MREKYVRRIVRVVIEGPARHVQEEIVLLENMRPHSYDVDIEVEEAVALGNPIGRPSEHATIIKGGNENDEHK